MKNRWIVVSAITTIIILLALSVQAQNSKPVVLHTLDGQVVKIDTKNKEVTIKGPKEDLTPDPTPTGRGSGQGGSAGVAPGGRGGHSRSSGSGGADMRRFEDVQTKIAWTDETEWISESADTVLKVSGLRVGDYVKVTATMKGRDLQATTIRRVTAVNGGGTGF